MQPLNKQTLLINTKAKRVALDQFYNIQEMFYYCICTLNRLSQNAIFFCQPDRDVLKPLKSAIVFMS